MSAEELLEVIKAHLIRTASNDVWDAVIELEDYIARNGGEVMSETTPRSTTSDVKLATLEAVPDAEMRAARLAHIGELAVAWQKKSKLADLCEHEDDKDPDLGRLWRAQDDAYLALVKACNEIGAMSQIAIQQCQADEREKERKENARILYALVDMINQYLRYGRDEDGLFSHEFMSAGEHTLYLMEEIGLMHEVYDEVFAFNDDALEAALEGVDRERW